MNDQEIIQHMHTHRQAIVAALAPLQEWKALCERWVPLDMGACIAVKRDTLAVQKSLQEFQAFVKGPVLSLACHIDYKSHGSTFIINMRSHGHIHDFADEVCIAACSHAYKERTEAAFRSLKNVRERLRTFIEHVQDDVIHHIDLLFPAESTCTVVVEVEPLQLSAPQRHPNRHVVSERTD